MLDDLMQTEVMVFSPANQTRAPDDFMRLWFRPTDSHNSIQTATITEMIQNGTPGQSCWSYSVMAVPIAATSLPTSDLEYRCKAALARFPVSCDTLKAAARSRMQ